MYPLSVSICPLTFSFADAMSHLSIQFLNHPSHLCSHSFTRPRFHSCVHPFIIRYSSIHWLNHLFLNPHFQSSVTHLSPHSFIHPVYYLPVTQASYISPRFSLTFIQPLSLIYLSTISHSFSQSIFHSFIRELFLAHSSTVSLFLLLIQPVTNAHSLHRLLFHLSTRYISINPLSLTLTVHLTSHSLIILFTYWTQTLPFPDALLSNLQPNRT